MKDDFNIAMGGTAFILKNDNVEKITIIEIVDFKKLIDDIL
jgi:hypothetical protein